MTRVVLRGRRKDRLRQTVALFQARRQGHAAYSTRLLVILPSGSGKIAARDALHRHHPGTLNDHAAAAQLIAIRLQVKRIIAHICRQQVVRHKVPQIVEPEEGELGQHLPLVGNFAEQNVVKSRNAVAGNKQQPVRSNGVQVADFTAQKRSPASESIFAHGSV